LKFKPRSRVETFDWFIVSGIAAICLSVIYYLRNYPNMVTRGLLTFSLLGLFLYMYFVIQSVHGMMYVIQTNGIRIHYGRRNIVIPYEEILSVDLIRRSNWRRLFGFALKDCFAGYFYENKYGLIQVFGTTNLDIIYIKTKGKRIAISPANNQLFMEELALRWKKEKREEDAYAGRPTKKRFWQDAPSLILAVGGTLLLLLSIAVMIYVWTSGINIDLLSYSLTGGTVERSFYIELLAFPIVILYFLLRTTWALDRILKEGVYDTARRAFGTLFIIVIITLILTSMVFIG